MPPAQPLCADVAIVGAGPTGLALAILLAQRGRSVVVLERFAAPYPLPRAVHFDHEVARVLQAVGLGRDSSRSQRATIYEWRRVRGRPCCASGVNRTGASGWPESTCAHQPRSRPCSRRARSFPHVRLLTASR